MERRNNNRWRDDTIAIKEERGGGKRERKKCGPGLETGVWAVGKKEGAVAVAPGGRGGKPACGAGLCLVWRCLVVGVGVLGRRVQVGGARPWRGMDCENEQLGRGSCRKTDEEEGGGEGERERGGKSEREGKEGERDTERGKKGSQQETTHQLSRH